jgi:hypothetical protein
MCSALKALLAWLEREDLESAGREVLLLPAGELLQALDVDGHNGTLAGALVDCCAVIERQDSAAN